MARHLSKTRIGHFSCRTMSGFTAKHQGKWKAEEVYREEGKSGKNTERPALQKLLSDIKSGLINTVLCAKIDRIIRFLIDFAAGWGQPQTPKFPKIFCPKNKKELLLGVTPSSKMAPSVPQKSELFCNSICRNES